MCDLGELPLLTFFSPPHRPSSHTCKIQREEGGRERQRERERESPPSMALGRKVVAPPLDPFAGACSLEHAAVERLNGGAPWPLTRRAVAIYPAQ
jgi:hypothetical protein